MLLHHASRYDLAHQSGSAENQEAEGQAVRQMEERGEPAVCRPAIRIHVGVGTRLVRREVQNAARLGVIVALGVAPDEASRSAARRCASSVVDATQTTGGVFVIPRQGAGYPGRKALPLHPATWSKSCPRSWAASSSAPTSSRFDGGSYEGSGSRTASCFSDSSLHLRSSLSPRWAKHTRGIGRHEKPSQIAASA